MKALHCDLGKLEYVAATGIQNALHQMVSEGAPDTLLFVEHEPVLTLGASFLDEHLMFSEAQYAEKGIAIERTARGGDVTYHAPGQLTIYPIFDLAKRGKDVHRWMRDLEETQLRTLSAFGLEGYRLPPHTGAWCAGKKVAAIGVKIKKWVSMHGIALNCDLDLTPFGWIIPCGIREYGVTSLSELLGRAVTVEDAKHAVLRAFADVFEMEFESVTLGELLPEHGQPG